MVEYITKVVSVMVIFVPIVVEYTYNVVSVMVIVVPILVENVTMEGSTIRAVLITSQAR